MMEEIVEPFQDRLIYESFDKRPTKDPAEGESYIRSQSQPDCRPDNAHYGTVEIPPYKSGNLSGDRRNYDLKHLEKYESNQAQWSERIDEMEHLLCI